MYQLSSMTLMGAGSFGLRTNLGFQELQDKVGKSKLSFTDQLADLFELVI